MVEIWLSYRDTEIPIMLPDPIDLRISSKTILPEVKEYSVLSDIYRSLKEFERVKIFFNPLSTDVEKHFIKNILSRAEIKFEESSYDEADICIDLFRYDPLLGYRTSLWSSYLYDDPIRKVFSLVNNYKGNEPDVLNYFNADKDKIYMDLIVDGGPRVVSMFSSNDGSHYREIISFYKTRWCLRSLVSKLIISSIGGSPWDSSFYLVVNSLIKLATLTEKDGIGILIGDGVLKDIDPTKIDKMEIKDVEKPEELYILYYFMNMKKYEGGTLVYYGSIPSTIMKMFGVRKIRDIEAYIRTIPKKLQREISVIEDMTFIYPYKCED